MSDTIFSIEPGDAAIIVLADDASEAQSPIASITFTKDLTETSGDQAVTGLGFRPRAIQFQTGFESGSDNASMGFSDGTVQNCMAIYQTSFGGAYDTFCGIARNAGGGGVSAFQTYTLKSMDEDGFTVTWIKNGTPSGTATIIALCFR